jgi:protoporphyrin/coproporphyrin ferrochelatase
MRKVKTGIVMMNLGGPATLAQVEPFLLELFADREIIQLPLQSWLGPLIARRRAPKVRNLYPQFSCSTTGSSLNELWRAADRTGLRDAFEWSIIDRWPVHPGFIDSMAETVRDGLEQFDAAVRDQVLLLFSAHSLPLDVIDRGDAYPQEIGASVQAVVERLARPNPYMLAFQSEVGPVRWLGPHTEQVLKQLGARGQKHVLVVPIAFTSDHIETLSELDREYGEVAQRAGITHYRRTPALNERPRFMDALASLVLEHLASGEPYGRLYRTRCPGCVNPQCRQIVNPVGSAVAAP